MIATWLTLFVSSACSMKTTHLSLTGESQIVQHWVKSQKQLPPTGYIPYKQKYWRSLYLVVCSNNTVGGILNWRISVLYGEKPMPVV